MFPILTALRADPEIELVLLVSGGHLVPSQGMTVNEIERDGFAIAGRLDVVLSGDGPTALAKSLGLGIISYADELRRLAPDVLLVPGDRYEAFAAAVAALPQEIVIAHVGGGQLTYGVMDERIRHALSKIAHIHFVLTEGDRNRLLRMGENPVHVHVVPATALSPVTPDGHLDRDALESSLGIALRPPVLAITYHPVTVDDAESASGLEALLTALDHQPTATLVFTAPNVDHGGGAILQRINEYVGMNPSRAVLAPSLGREGYSSLVRCSAAVVGNSSSGLVDAPLAGVPTVNIGSRQAGRNRPSSVIDCPAETAAISAAIASVCARHTENPGKAHSRPSEDLRELVVAPIRQASYSSFRKKPFFDQPW